jgi:hypothetical protein
MAEHGLLSAPNMAIGEPFNIGITSAQAGPVAAVPAVGDGSLGAPAGHPGA